MIEISRFENLTKDKSTVINRLIEDQELCKALYYTNEDFLDNPDVSPSKLIRTHIFPHRRVYDLSDTAISYITLSFDGFKPVKTHYKSGLITIYAFTHHTLFSTDYGLRYDFMANRIDEMMNHERGIGIGKASFEMMREFEPNEKYLGYAMTYKVWEFN